MPVFTNDGHIFNATFLFATGKAWNDISVSASALSKVSDVCHTHIASGFPNFPLDHVLCLAFLLRLSWNVHPNLSGSSCLNLSPVSCISFSGLMADAPEQKSHLKPRVCPPPQNSAYSHDHKHPLWCPTITLASLDVEPVQIQLQFPSSSLCCNMD